MIVFQPPWYTEKQAYIRKVQSNCVGFHAPELKLLCGPCATKVFDAIALTERERCALYAESVGQRSLAAQLRDLQ